MFNYGNELDLTDTFVENFDLLINSSIASNTLKGLGNKQVWWMIGLILHSRFFKEGNYR